MRQSLTASQIALDHAPEAQNESVRAEETCTRDTARLVRLRAEPTLEAIDRFEKESGCEQLRSQLGDCARASSPDLVRTRPDSALDRRHLLVTFPLASDATTSEVLYSSTPIDGVSVDYFRSSRNGRHVDERWCSAVVPTSGPLAPQTRRLPISRRSRRD